MGTKTRGGLSRAAYRALRQAKAKNNAKPPLPHGVLKHRAELRAAELAKLPKPEHNTIHGTHTGPKTAARRPVVAPEVTGYRLTELERVEKNEDGTERVVVIREHRAIEPRVVAGVAAALALSTGSRGDDGAKPYQKPSVPRGRIANIKSSRAATPVRKV